VRLEIISPSAWWAIVRALELRDVRGDFEEGVADCRLPCYGALFRCVTCVHRGETVFLNRTSLNDDHDLWDILIVGGILSQLYAESCL